MSDRMKNVAAGIGAFVALVGLLGSWYVNLTRVPEIAAAAKDHEKRITVVETKIDYIAGGVDRMEKMLAEDRRRSWRPREP